MTNEQLRLLLICYRDRLEWISEEVDNALPGDVERTMEWWHKEEGWKADSCHFVFLLNKEKYEERPTGYAVCLQSLRDFIDELEDAISDLRGFRVQYPIDIKGIV